MIRYIFKEADVINGPGRGKNIFSRRKCLTKNWQLSIWSCRQLWEHTSCANRALRNNCWIDNRFYWLKGLMLIACYVVRVCLIQCWWLETILYTRFDDSIRVFLQNSHGGLHLSMDSNRVGCWLLVCQIIDLLLSGILHTLDNSGDSGAEGTSIRLLRDEAALLGRVEVFLKASSCFFTVCATSTFSFVRHAASLRESSASTLSDCVS